MELQDATILYLALILPIILILNFSLSTTIQEIRIENDYQNKLLDATRDGIKAFEINTSNEKFNDVTDALKIMVEASINTFREGFAKRMGISGASKSVIDNYVPFTLFTLNDGYYINSPSFTPHTVKFKKNGVAAHIGDYGVSKPESGNIVDYTIDNEEYNKATDKTNTNVVPEKQYIYPSHNPVIFQKYLQNENAAGDKVSGTTNPTDKNVVYDRSNVLKNYVPYSARYKNNDFDVIISYSMDNYLSAIGHVKGNGEDEYFSRSGYILDPKIKIEVTGIKGLDLNKGISDYTVDKLVDHANSEITLVIKNIKRRYVNPENGKEETEDLEDITIKYNPENMTTGYIDPVKTENAYIIQQREAIKYYIKSYYFTKWVYAKLGNIKLGDFQPQIPDQIQKAFGNELLSNPVFDKNKLLFEANEKEGYAITDYYSDYNLHKRNVMRNSIEYNLYIAASNYSKVRMNSLKNAKAVYRSDMEIPLISENDWDKLCSHITMVSFAHGLKTPRKTYTSYALVSSGDNQYTVDENGLYFVENSYFDLGNNAVIDNVNRNQYAENGNYKYHRITSTEIIDGKDANGQERKYVGDLVNNFIYDGKILTAAEKLKYTSNNTENVYREREFVRKNFKSYRSIVEDNVYKKEDVTLKDTPGKPDRSSRRTALYAAIGAIKNQRYNLITINENRSFKIYSKSGDPLQGNIGIGRYDVNLKAENMSTGYMPAIKDIQVVIKLPRITDMVAHTEGFNTIVNPTISADLVGRWGTPGDPNSYTERVPIKLSPRGDSASGNDINFQTKEIINLTSKIVRDKSKKPGALVDIDQDQSYGIGEEVSIELENIKTNIKNAPYVPDLEIVEVRVNYN